MESQKIHVPNTNQHRYIHHKPQNWPGECEQLSCRVRPHMVVAQDRRRHPVAPKKIVQWIQNTRKLFRGALTKRRSDGLFTRGRLGLSSLLSQQREQVTWNVNIPPTPAWRSINNMSKLHGTLTSPHPSVAKHQQREQVTWNVNIPPHPSVAKHQQREQVTWNVNIPPLQRGVASTTWASYMERSHLPHSSVA